MGTVIGFSSAATSMVTEAKKKASTQNDDFLVSRENRYPKASFPIPTPGRCCVTGSFGPSKRYTRPRKKSPMVLKSMIFLEEENISPVTTQGSGNAKDGVSSSSGTYLMAELTSSVGLISLDMMAICLRFWWNMDDGGEIQVWEMAGSFVVSVGTAVGMELWSRWVHKALWHAPMWQIHKSHHRPREGAFELNDIFAVMNSFPAIVLISIGFFNSGLLPALCFGAGVGITFVGIAYVIVHDGMVHRRFPVGPIVAIPYLRRVALAHRIHSEKFNGVPFGFFLGPKELEEVVGRLTKE